MGNRNFRKVKKFVIDIIRSWKIGSNKMRVAIVSFSKRAFINFNLHRYSKKSSLIRAIRKIKYMSGGTNTYFALQLLHRVFKRQNGDRNSVPNIAIVITDGVSSNSKRTILAANTIKRAGVDIFSVGIGRKFRRSELQAMASHPKYKHIFTVGKFNALKRITKSISKKICQGMFMFNYLNLADSADIIIYIKYINIKIRAMSMKRS